MLYPKVLKGYETINQIFWDFDKSFVLNIMEDNVEEKTS